MAVGDELFDGRNLRDEAKLVREAAGRPGGGRGVPHRARLLHAHREGLLAEDVLARRKGCENVLRVSERWRGDGDGVELATGEHLLARAEGVRDSLSLGDGRRLGWRRHRDDFKARVQAQRREVRERAEAGADDPNP